MRILTDCPVVLSRWRELSDESTEVEALGRTELGLWGAVAGSKPAWELDDRVPCPAGGVVMVVEHSRESQFDIVHRLARSAVDIPTPFFAVALQGEKFHGQADRPWIADPGNLHLTARFKVDIPASGALAAISVLPTLAVTDAYAIQTSPQERTGIRWLNDVFVRGRKLAGSIAVSEVEGDRIRGLLFGIGVNVETVPSVPGNVFVPSAASLRSSYPEAGWSLGRAMFGLIGSLVRRVDEFQSGKAGQLVDVFAKRSACVGLGVRIWPKNADASAPGDPVCVGKLLSIGDDLAVRIEGRAEPVAEGRLAFGIDSV